MLAAGTGLKLFDLSGYFVNFNGVLPGNETVNFFFFVLHFSVRYNVCFIKIICTSMPRRLNVFFPAFFIKFLFLHLKKAEGYE